MWDRFTQEEDEVFLFYKTSALALAAVQPPISNPCPRDKSASV
jgi:hypothetical protein